MPSALTSTSTPARRPQPIRRSGKRCTAVCWPKSAAAADPLRQAQEGCLRRRPPGIGPCHLELLRRLEAAQQRGDPALLQLLHRHIRLSVDSEKAGYAPVPVLASRHLRAANGTSLAYSAAGILAIGMEPPSESPRGEDRVRALGRSTGSGDSPHDPASGLPLGPDGRFE